MSGVFWGFRLFCFVHVFPLQILHKLNQSRGGSYVLFLSHSAVLTTNHLFVPEMFIPSFPFFPNLSDSHIFLSSSSLPQPIPSSKFPLTLFPQRFSVPSQHSLPLSQDFLAVWRIFCLYRLDPGDEMCCC